MKNILCNKCKKMRSENEFYLIPASGNIRRPCKPCRAEYALKWSKSDSGKILCRINRAKTYEKSGREYAKIYRQSEEYREKQRARSRKYKLENPEKVRAHSAIRNALRSGKMKRLPCEICGSVETHGHHENYNAPLDVIWFCRKHHKLHHLGALS